MNEAIFYFFHNLAHQSPFFDSVVIFLAKTFPYVVGMLALLFLLLHHEVFKAENPFQILAQKYKEILLVFFSGALAWVCSYTLKFLLEMPRPFDILDGVSSVVAETGYAFPSGHSAFFMALATAVFFTHKKAGYVFGLFAVVIGLSRIAAGVHFPIDILGGFILGFLVGYFVFKVSRKFAYFRRNV